MQVLHQDQRRRILADEPDKVAEHPDQLALAHLRVDAARLGSFLFDRKEFEQERQGAFELRFVICDPCGDLVASTGGLVLDCDVEEAAEKLEYRQERDVPRIGTG